MKKQGLETWLYSLLGVAAVFLLIVAVNALAAGAKTRIDLTAEHAYTLSPGTRAMPKNRNRPDLIINPVKIAEAFWYLHTQDRSCWTHELQLTPFPTKPSY